MNATGCILERANVALDLLIEIGWKAPAAVRQNVVPIDFNRASDGKQLLLSSASPLIAHTDGACSGNPGPGGWAVVFSQDGKIVGQHTGHEPATTNNQMELIAIREAIRRSPAQCRLQIVTDSQLAIGWLCQKWKRKEPANAVICAEIDKLRASRASGTNGQGGVVSFDYVKGHNGDPMNELADQLATSAIRKTATQGTKLECLT
jgi:ribonuclease HI